MAPHQRRAGKSEKQRRADGVLKKYARAPGAVNPFGHGKNYRAMPQVARKQRQAANNTRQPYANQSSANQSSANQSGIQITINNKKKRINPKVRCIGRVMDANERDRQWQAEHEEEKKRFADKYFWRFAEMRRMEREAKKSARELQRRDNYSRRR